MLQHAATHTSRGEDERVAAMQMATRGNTPQQDTTGCRTLRHAVTYTTTGVDEQVAETQLASRCNTL